VVLVQGVGESLRAAARLNNTADRSFTKLKAHLDREEKSSRALHKTKLAPKPPARNRLSLTPRSKAPASVVLRGPLCARGPPRGRRRRRGTRHPAGGGDASGGGGRQGGDAGAGTMGPPRCRARATGGAYPTRRASARGPRGGPGWRA